MLAIVAAVALCLAQLAHAAPQGGNPSSASSSSSDASLTSVPAPTVTVSTAVASPTVSLDATLPSQIPDPPVQSWCTSQIFCAGPLLQTINVAGLYADPKTFVDKPTSASAQTVLANFNNLTNASSSLTESQLVNFVDGNFGGEGTELEGLPIQDFNPSPSFLQNVTDPLVRAWSGVVHGYWTQLIRGTNQSTLCSEGDAGSKCESTLIPLNHTFVVPGGRFREQYYWDSYWIVQGLIKSELFDLVNATLQNFMDELETIGFIPNGGRIYYLNRSQPPLFINMLADYVSATNNTAILDRALPLAERELTWWQENRTVNVTSPFTNQTYAVARYAAANTAPRPESYLTDYNTANDPNLPTLSESERSDLYAELASGAETGWDYTARFIAQPLAGGSNNTNPALRTLQVRSTIPICLNSILYRANTLLASLYELRHNSTAASTHLETASHIRSAVLDLFWDADKLAFYDFNLTSHARNNILSTATFYPYWAGIIPDAVLSNATNAFGAFASLNAVLRRYNGTYPTTFVESGLQWDAPNAWPPHQYILLDALRALPANVSGAPLPAPPGGQSGFALVPAGQMGMDEGALPGQPLAAGENATRTGAGADVNALDGTVVNGGNATQGEGWRDQLARELANRYISSAFCSWYSTGGSIPGVLPQLSQQALNISNSIGNTGNMFEKFSNQDVDAGGSGGEYTVQAGFGWTNGVALWVAKAAIIGGSGTQTSGVPSLNDCRMGMLTAALAAVAGYLLL